MSDDRVRLHVKHLLFRFLLHLCFVVILYSRCVLAPPPYNNDNTEHKYSLNIFRLVLSISQVYLNAILSIFLRST